MCIFALYFERFLQNWVLPKAAIYETIF